MLKRSHLRFRTEYHEKSMTTLFIGEATFRGVASVSDMLVRSDRREYLLRDYQEQIYQEVLSSLLGQLRERIRERLIRNIENAGKAVSDPLSSNPVLEAELLLSEIMTMFRGED